MPRDRKTTIRTLLAITLAGLLTGTALADEQPGVVYDGSGGPGEGKHIVLVSGDEEYRSEEALPQLGKILAKRHGFKCTVLFAIHPETGEIHPDTTDNIPGLDALKNADLMVIATRFRNLPDEQMKHIVEYVESGRPIIGLRTATHAFNIPEGRKYHHYSWNTDAEGWEQGFGRQVLGETWIAHHGEHSEQSTRGVIPDAAENHPITRGISDGDIWGRTDVYKVRLPLPGDSRPIVLGRVLAGMEPDAEPVEGGKNDPMMPVAWTRTWETPGGETARVFTTTMGAAGDLRSEGVRRMLVNACYWALGMAEQIPSGGTDVALVGDYDPTPFGFGGFQKGLTPADFEMKAAEQQNDSN